MTRKFVDKWVIAMIKPNSFKMALRNLERQGFELFGPKMKITIKNKDKFINKDTLVFPGYLFVRITKQTPCWTKINFTYGVSKVLGFNEIPFEISNDVILELKNRFKDDDGSIINEKLKIGDKVKFINGPFVDFMAKIEAVDDKSRIWVLLEVMGKYKKLKLQQKQNKDIIKFKY